MKSQLVRSPGQLYFGALEPIVHHLSISDEDKNAIRYTASNWIANLRPTTNLRKNDARALPS